MATPKKGAVANKTVPSKTITKKPAAAKKLASPKGGQKLQAARPMMNQKGKTTVKSKPVKVMQQNAKKIVKKVATAKPIVKKSPVKKAIPMKKIVTPKKAVAVKAKVVAPVKKVVAVKKAIPAKKVVSVKKPVIAKPIIKKEAAKKPVVVPLKKPVVKAPLKKVAMTPAQKAAPSVRKKMPALKPLKPSVQHASLMGLPPYREQQGEEYMNADQQQHFRSILALWKRDLMEEVDKTVHHMQDEAANFPDPNDRATQEEEFSLELRARDRDRKLIKKIDEALQRLEDEEYGYCEACGVEIGVRRLEARPTATLCIDCKTLDEIKERQFGG